MKYYERPEGLVPWQPSTWPPMPSTWTGELRDVLRDIIDGSIVCELSNVIDDATHRNGDLRHRGHVIALSLLCAIDAVAAYGYLDEPTTTPCSTCGRGEKLGPRYEAFIRSHFGHDYPAIAHDLYVAYRNSTVHSWHFFKVAIHPGHEKAAKADGGVSFGLRDFFDAFKEAIEDFLKKLETEPRLQRNALKRYTELRGTAH